MSPVQSAAPHVSVNPRPAEELVNRPPQIDVRDLNFYYGAKRALEHITIGIQPNLVTAFIGPSGCGKSTFLRTLNRMAWIAQTMLRDALDAYVRRDTSLAQRVLDADDSLDALKTQVFRELLDFMLKDPNTIEPGLDLILVSRHLERIGDHATNVAEDVIFMVSGRDVRHHAADQI